MILTENWHYEYNLPEFRYKAQCKETCEYDNTSSKDNNPVCEAVSQGGCYGCCMGIKKKDGITVQKFSLVYNVDLAGLVGTSPRKGSRFLSQNGGMQVLC